jgi:hypothetical protein
MHLLWVNARDTHANIEAKRDCLIAAGRARPDIGRIEIPQSSGWLPCPINRALTWSGYTGG